jgi:protein-S-isoprenylcysteine O-methyltransferase Ste14
MPMRGISPEGALYALWIVWYSSWLLSLFWTGRATARPDYRQHGPYQMMTTIGLVLLFGPPILQMTPDRLWPQNEALGWTIFGLTLLVFTFMWWARIEMGRLWSGYIAIGADHRVIDTGPFAIVRHPIYSGIIAAAFLMAAEQATPAAFGGALFLSLSFWMKAQLEEVFLRRELGPQDYDAYRRRVPMLVPFGPKSA